jgi:adenylate kinase
MIRLFTSVARFGGNKAAPQADQKFLFLFGAPGVGKGTYAKMLRKDLNYNHISTGD